MPHRVRSPDDPTARLRLAARTGKLSALQKLLGREPPWRINEAREEDGWTALHLACFWGHAACAKALIRAGAAVDLPDIEGRTALHMACLYDEPEAARLLLNAYADKTFVAGNSGKTALDLAHESGATGCVALLLEHDMPPVKPVFGERTLRSATKGATTEHPDVVPRRAQELSPVEAPRAHPAGRRLQLARSLPPLPPPPPHTPTGAQPTSAQIKCGKPCPNRQVMVDNTPTGRGCKRPQTGGTEATAAGMPVDARKRPWQPSCV